MNTLKTLEVSSADIYQRITNFGVEVYKQERLNNPDFSYKDILRIILQRLKKYCNQHNLSFDDFQKYGIENKIHFGLLAKKQLSSTILNAMSVVNSDIYTLISQPYTINSCTRLIEIKESLQRDKRINNQLSNNRNLANSLLRENNKKVNNGSTQIIGNNSKSKSKQKK